MHLTQMFQGELCMEFGEGGALPTCPLLDEILAAI